MLCLVCQLKFVVIATYTVNALDEVYVRNFTHLPIAFAFLRNSKAAQIYVNEQFVDDRDFIRSVNISELP